MECSPQARLDADRFVIARALPLCCSITHVMFSACRGPSNPAVLHPRVSNIYSIFHLDLPKETFIHIFWLQLTLVYWRPHINLLSFNFSTFNRYLYCLIGGKMAVCRYTLTGLKAI